MSYRFRQPDRLAVEVRRVATERLEHALEQLGSGLADDQGKAVHEARKDLKKTRTLLRLTKESLGEDRYRAENERLRAAAHFLAGAREADAKVESLAALLESAGGRLSAVTRTEGNAWMVGLQALTEERADLSEAAANAAGIITGVRDEARSWSLGYGSFEIVGPGLRRTYRLGRRYLARATNNASDETLHEWRKRVKDMWYSLRLLGEVWPPVIGPMADQAHELSERLGDHHDLGELRIELESGDTGILPGARTELLSHVRARQGRLHGEAIALGRRLYADKPGRYVARLESLWTVWAEDASQQLGQDGLPGL